MRNLVIDTSAWMEYFLDTSKGRLVAEYLEKHTIITPSIVLLELSYKSEEEGWDYRKVFDFIKIKSRILGFSEQFIFSFGKTYLEARKKQKDFGLADSIILTTAIQEKALLLTKDTHFRNFSDVVLLS